MLSSLLLGVGLSAGCGLRVFLPVLALSAAAWLEYVTLSRGFAWLGSSAALVAIASCAFLELAALFVPRAARILDLAATPAAMVAGTLLTAAVLREASPIEGLVLPLLLGGGMAGMSQSLAAFRPLAPALASGYAALLSIFALLSPLPAGALVIAYIAIRWKQVLQAVRN